MVWIRKPGPCTLGSQTLPMVETLPGGIFPGRTIVVEGKANYDAENILFHFSCGVGEGAPVVFQVDFSFEHNHVLRNSFTPAQKWGTTEDAGKMPMLPGNPFEVQIHCTDDSFIVDVDGAHCCRFSHRYELDTVTHFVVSGDAEVEKIEIHDD